LKHISIKRHCTVLAVMMAVMLLVSFSAMAAQSGSLGVVTAIEIRGNSRIDSDDILKAMTIKIGDELTESAIQQSFVAMDSLGWFADLGANTVPHFGGIKLIIVVQEFPVVNKILVSGNALIPTDELLGVMKSKVGSQLNANQLRTDLQALGSHYHEKGYWVSIEPSLSDTGDLTLHLVEWTVSEVKFAGNQKTKPKVIQRCIETQPGDYINVNKINEDRRRIYMLGAFEDVEAKVEPVPGKFEYVVTYVLTERKTGIANLALTYSSQDKLMGYIELGDENFLGNAQTVNIKAEFGRSKTNYELGFYEPWVGASGKTSVGFNLFSKTLAKQYTPSDENETLSSGAVLGLEEAEVDPIEYTQRRTGGNVTVGRTLSLNTKAFVKFKMENAINIAAESEYADQIPPGGTTRSLTLSAVNDTRDDLWNPATGHKLSSSLEYAGGILGGDNDFAKLQGEACQYYQVRDGHILAGRVSAGYGFDGLPVDERFRIGGAETVRGYKYGDIEGDRMTLANAEYRFNITKGLQGVLFCDAGQAWNADGSFDVSNTKVGYGAGVRIMVPVLGMIRIDYGIGDSGGQAYFSFGQTF
jgi:outer membrane protein insertion porin family